MDTDLVLTIGIVLLALTIPALLAAWVDGRVPRVGAVVLIGSLVMIIWAQLNNPGGYAVAEIPDVMLSVLGQSIR